MKDIKFFGEGRPIQMNWQPVEDFHTIFKTSEKVAYYNCHDEEFQELEQLKGYKMWGITIYDNIIVVDCISDANID